MLHSQVNPIHKIPQLPQIKCIFHVERVLHVHVFFLMSVWHMAAGSGFAMWCLLLFPSCSGSSSRLPGALGGTPADTFCPLQGVHEGDIWGLSSLSVDRPPVEPSQYISVPPKHPDKMGFDEVRSLFCCLLSCLLAHHLILNVPSSSNHAMILCCSPARKRRQK